MSLKKTSTWNHRVLRKKDVGGEWYAVHEVYYDKKGKPTGATQDEVGPCGETLEQLKAELEMFARALDKPVLDYETLQEVAASGEEVNPHG